MKALLLHALLSGWDRQSLQSEIPTYRASHKEKVLTLAQLLYVAESNHCIICSLRCNFATNVNQSFCNHR